MKLETDKTKQRKSIISMPNKNTFRTILLTGFFILFTCIPSYSDVAKSTENIAGDWQRHTVFSHIVKKIMDGERYTYIWAHQSFYGNQDYGARYDMPIGTVLYYDKQNPSAGVRALDSRCNLGGVEVRQAEYNVKAGYLVVIYTDGVIDLVRDNGSVVTIDKFKKSNPPMAVNSVHISFPIADNDTWISTKTGYIHIDGSTMSVAENVNLNKEVRCINRVGDHIVAIIGNEVYEAPAGTKIRGISDFTSKGNIAGDADLIMPIDNTRFVTLAESKSTPACRIALVSRSDEGEYNVSLGIEDTGFYGQLTDVWVDGWTIDHPFSVCAQNENIMQPNKSGYMLFSKQTAYQINLPADAASNPEILTRKLASSYPLYLGSYDFENFIRFTPHYGFHIDKATGFNSATTWSAGEYIPSNCPPGLEFAKFQYSPQYGMLMMNGGSSSARSSDRVLPILLSGYKNGKWTNFSPYHLEPEATASNSSLRTHWSNPSSLYPMGSPMGFCLDPLNPNYVIIGSVYDGTAAINLDNVHGQILHYSAPNSSYKNYPGFKAVPMPKNPNPWNSTCAMLPAGFDADNIYWSYFPDAREAINGRNYLNLWYWTPEARNPAFAEQDINKAGDWGTISIPLDFNIVSNAALYGKALKHPQNKNTLYVFSDGPYQLIRYNHKGTLSDTSDDVIDCITGFITPDKDYYEIFFYIYNIAENPVNGDVYVSTYDNIFVIHPNAKISGTILEAELLSTTNADGSKTPVIPYNRANDIIFDEYNRMWLATNGNGVMGITTDMSRVFAHYTVDNSILPSNLTYGVGWNPESKELMMSSKLGIVSCKPDAPTEINVASLSTSPFVTPQAVTPGYAGLVTLHNIPKSCVINVTDKKGKLIRALYVADDNSVIWDLLDNDMTPVPTGTYLFVDKSNVIEPVEFYVLR